MNSTRRSFLGVTTVAGIGTVAGCLDDLPLIGESDLPAFADWLPAAKVDNGTSIISMDITVLQDWPAEAREDILEGLAEDIGVEEDDLEHLFILEQDLEMYAVALGSFDPDEVADKQNLEETYDEYEGFDVYVEEGFQGETYTAIGEEAVIDGGEDYPEIIDAGQGDTDRIADVDETWDQLLSEYGHSGIALFGTQGDEFLESEEDAVETFAIGMDAVGDDLEGAGEFHFADEASAEAGADELEAEFEDDDEVDDYSIEQDGTVVTLEIVDEDFEW